MHNIIIIIIISPTILIPTLNGAFNSKASVGSLCNLEFNERNKQMQNANII